MILQQHSHSGPDGKGRGLRIFENIVPTLAMQMGTGGNNVPMVANAVDCDGYLRNGARPRDENGKPQLLPIGYRWIRRLTPTECERLQGFPDGWTQFGIAYKTVQPLGNIWQQVNVLWKVAQETSLSENQNYVLCTTNVGENGATQTQLSLLPESLWQKLNASIVVGLAKVELGECVSDITNLGSDMVMLSKQNETSQIDTLTVHNLISARMEEKFTYPLLNLQLEENCPKAKLSIILTSIKEIIESKTCIFFPTGKPIINVIVHSKKLPNRYSQRELLPSQTESIVEISDTQRYKLLGNAVTVNVIQFLGQRLSEKLEAEQ